MCLSKGEVKEGETGTGQVQRKWSRKERLLFRQGGANFRSSFCDLVGPFAGWSRETLQGLVGGQLGKNVATAYLTDGRYSLLPADTNATQEAGPQKPASPGTLPKKKHLGKLPRVEGG